MKMIKKQKAKGEIVNSLISIASVLQDSLLHNPYIYTKTIDKVITRFEFDDKKNNIAVIHIPGITVMPEGSYDVKKFYHLFFHEYARMLSLLIRQQKELSGNFWQLCKIKRIETMVLRHEGGPSFMYAVEDNFPVIIDVGCRPGMSEVFEKELMENLENDNIIKTIVKLPQEEVSDQVVNDMIDDLMEKLNGQETKSKR